MKIIPLTLKTANHFVEAHHRHHGRTVGMRFAVGLMHDGMLVGVAVVGRPVARALDDGFTAEVTRLCVTDCAPKGACSKLYSSCQRAWFAMGGQRLVTYTLAAESGASLRGAGWALAATVEGGQWSCQSRPRRKKTIYDQEKLRWEVLLTATSGRQ